MTYHGMCYTTEGNNSHACSLLNAYISAARDYPGAKLISRGKVVCHLDTPEEMVSDIHFHDMGNYYEMYSSNVLEADEKGSADKTFMFKGDLAQMEDYLINSFIPTHQYSSAHVTREGKKRLYLILSPGTNYFEIVVS